MTPTKMLTRKAETSAGTPPWTTNYREGGIILSGDKHRMVNQMVSPEMRGVGRSRHGRLEKKKGKGGNYLIIFH